MDHKRYGKRNRKRENRRAQRQTALADLKRIAALLLAGSVLLAGCSAGRAPEDSEPEWSFQAGGVQEEEAKAEEPGGQAGAGTEAAQLPAENADSPEEEKEEPETTGYVYVCGAVASPGVYEIEKDTRVFEVIGQAGGLTAQADAEWLNQAEIVRDGQKLQIYTKKETAAFREAGLSSPDGAAAGAGGIGQEMGSGDAKVQGAAGDDKVNINTADKELLMTLPGIGESKAEAVLQYRQEHGNFGSIDDICQVSGIKEAVFSRIKDRITV